MSDVLNMCRHVCEVTVFNTFWRTSLAFFQSSGEHSILRKKYVYIYMQKDFLSIRKPQDVMLNVPPKIPFPPELRTAHPWREKKEEGRQP